MGIIYGVSVVLLFVSYLLIQKSKEKTDILKQIVLNFVLLFCYNAFVCYVLTFFTIPVNLLGLSIINFILSLIMIIYLIKTKKVQKYYLKKLDLLFVILIGIAVLIVSYLNFGFPFEIKYETGDPSTHFHMADLFAERDGLLAGEEPEEVYGSYASTKTASYVNSGLIMKCFQGIIEPFDNYIIFIAFGIFVLFLTGWMFYSTISRFAKENLSKLLAFMVSILYVMGYPLNSFLFGFEYFSMGILILGAIIASIDTYQNNEIGFKQNLLVFFLLNYGLFTAYYMFVPYVYSGLWIYFCINEYKKKKKLFTKKLFLMLLITLLLPFGLGYIYHIAPEIYGIFIHKSVDISTATKQPSGIVNSFSYYGYIYVNLFSNIIPLLPFAIMAMYKKWKENRGVSIITLITMIFIYALIIGNIFNKVSAYYLSKNYYALWLLLYYLAFKGLLIMYEKNKLAPVVLVITYIIIIVINLVFFNVEFSHGVIDKEENILQIVDIYNANKTILKRPSDLNTEELELLKYMMKNIPEDKKVELAGDIEQGFWGYALTKRINDDEPNYWGKEKIEQKMIYVGRRAQKVDYVVYFNKGQFYQLWKNILWKNAEKVYENEAGGILKYNNVD